MKPHDVLQFYKIGKVCELEQLSQGLIHQTYRVTTEADIFVLQKLHPIFAKEMVQNVDAASTFLNAHGVVAQKVVPTKSGQLLVDTNNEFWRLLTFIPGKVYDKVENDAVALEAGKMLGTFHRVLRNAPIQFASQRSSGAPNYLKKFREVVSKNEIPQNMQPFLKTLEKVFEIDAPTDLQRGIIQGDPKITNIIFNHDGTRAIAMIDIDDVGPGELLNDMTDAARSWCSNREDIATNTFSLSKFHAMLSGYQDGSGKLLNLHDAHLLPRMLQRLILILASRFFVDWFEDSYFGFDAKRFSTRKEHNFARIQGQLALYKDVATKESEMIEVVKRFV